MKCKASYREGAGERDQELTYSWSSIVPSQQQLPCKKWSLAVHWWHLNCDCLGFQEQWVSSLPETHWVTPPAMGSFSPCPGTWHCLPLNRSLHSILPSFPFPPPQTMSFPELPWIVAPEELVNRTAFFIPLKTVAAACPFLTSVPQNLS